MEYTINSAFGDLHNLFQINTTNGEVKVNLRNGFILDRDMGTTYHYIPIDIRDNFNFINTGYGRKYINIWVFPRKSVTTISFLMVKKVLKLNFLGILSVATDA